MDNKIWLSTTKEYFLKDKVILLRIDSDVDLKEEKGELVVDEDFRIKSVLPTIRFLQNQGVSRIIMLGHLGRPGGRPVKELSLKPVADWFSEHLGKCRLAVDYSTIEPSDRLVLLENLRFDTGEEVNDKHFIAKLAVLGDVFVNDAFGVSHRDHASITGLAKSLPSFLGLRFEAEVKTLSWIKTKAKRPLVFVLGGSKQGKLDYIPFLAEWADYLLVGGKLPVLIKNSKFKIENSKLIVAELKENNRDINTESVKRFKQVINQGETIVWAGPMGVYEEEENWNGTFEIAKAVANSAGFKIAGGGDTHRVLSWTNLWDKFDFVSVGGGAALQFLKDNTLPGLKAIEK